MKKNNRLATARKAKGLTQEQLALLLGYKGRQAVANWENGYANPPLTIGIEIAKLLESDVDFLFGFKVQETYIKPA